MQKAPNTRALPLHTSVSALFGRPYIQPEETVRFADHMPKIDGVENLPKGIFCGLRNSSASKLMYRDQTKTLQCSVTYAIPRTGFFALPEAICSSATRVQLLESMLPFIPDKEDVEEIQSQLRMKARPSTFGLTKWATCRHPQALLSVMEKDPSIRAVDCYVWVNRRAVRVLFFRAEEARDVRVRWHDEIEAVLH